MIEKHQSSASDEAVLQLLQKLKTVRQGCEGLADQNRREILKQTLQEELKGLSEVESTRRLDGVREQLVQEACQREARLQQLEAEVARTRAEMEALRAERDRVAQNAPTAPSAGATDDAASAQALDRIRLCLRLVTEDKIPPPDQGLSPANARLFRLFAEILQFALKLERAALDARQDMRVGSAMMNTVMIKRQKDVIRERFRACLDNEDGSVRALSQALEQTLQLMVGMNTAYVYSIPQGARKLLVDLNPQPILDENTGKFSVNWESAWRALSNHHSDLSTLNSEDLIERFFQPDIQKKLEEFLLPAPPETP